MRPSANSGRSEHYHAADRLAAAQSGKALVDLVERNVARDQFVELEAAIEIGAGEQREVAHRAGAAIARPADALFAHQRTPAERHIVRDIGLAEPDHLATRPNRLDAGAKR